MSYEHYTRDVIFTVWEGERHILYSKYIVKKIFRGRDKNAPFPLHHQNDIPAINQARTRKIYV
jgi:hypothetical protein